MNNFITKLKKKKAIIIAFLVFGVILFIYHKLMWGDLKTNGIIVKGVIKSQTFHSKSSMVDVGYTYIYRNKEYYDESNSGVLRSSIFIGKIFPVIVSQTSSNSTMLITPHHFKTFNIPFPDSLKWVLNYLDNQFYKKRKL